VTVYTTLLRSYYRDKLTALDAGGQLSRKQRLLGVNPLHPLLLSSDGPDMLVSSGAYEENIVALMHALEIVAGLWKKGSGEEGLQNQRVIAHVNERLPLVPWSDTRYSSSIEDQWSNKIAGEKMTRWGHVSVLSLTPHYLITPKRKDVENLAPHQDPLEVLRGFVSTVLLPQSLGPLPRQIFPVSPGFRGVPRSPREAPPYATYATLMEPFYDRVIEEIHVWPIGGSDESLWQHKSLALYTQDLPRGCQEGLYRWNLDDSFYFLPKTAASVVTFMAILPKEEGVPAFGRFLAAFGGTEVTKIGDLDYQRRFAPTRDFAERTWRTLLLVESAFGDPEHELTPP
jgi:hypothetical protein